MAPAGPVEAAGPAAGETPRPGVFAECEVAAELSGRVRPSGYWSLLCCDARFTLKYAPRQFAPSRSTADCKTAPRDDSCPAAAEDPVLLQSDSDECRGKAGVVRGTYEGR